MKQKIKFILFFLAWCISLYSKECEEPSFQCILNTKNDQPVAKFILEENQIKYRKFYFYDDKGKISETIIDDGKSIDISDLSDVTKRFVNTYTSSDPNSIDIEETESTVCNAIESNVYTKLNTFGKSIYEKGSAFLNLLNQFALNCSYSHYIKNDLDKFATNLFGEKKLMLHGYYPSLPIQTSVFGKGEVNDKVRITFINGILNNTTDCFENCKLFSETHGNVNIHYVFSPTDGFSADIIESVFLKFGYISPQAKLLAKMWKELIEEMGGIDGNGKIIHYAHSIGAADTWAARNLLTAEEEAMISIYTFGSPSLIKVNGFKEVTNYVSVRDGVCLLDPLGFLSGVLKHHHNSLSGDGIFWAPVEQFVQDSGFDNVTTYVNDHDGNAFGIIRYLLEQDNTVVFLGDLFGIPLIDHTLSAESYSQVITERGNEFINQYGMIE